MSFFGKILGEAGAETAKGLAEGVGKLALDMRSAITGDMKPETAARLEQLAVIGEQMAAQGQMEINKAEAVHRSIFVAGWRPFIGWVCGCVLSWHFLIHPITIWILVLVRPETPGPPLLDLGQLYPVILGMLGLSGLRTYEKKAGIQRRH